MLRRAVVSWICVFACGCGGVEGVEDELADEGLVGEDGQALFSAPSCVEADLCTAPSQSRPQCYAAALEGSFAFETVQTFDVTRAGSYDFVRLGLRRLFPGFAGLLRVELRELTGGIASIEGAPVRASGTLVLSLVGRTSGWNTIRLTSPVTLGLSNGPTPRYALVVTVDAGRGSVGLACADDLDVFAAGRTYFRKRRPDGAGGWTVTPFREGRRDLSFALGLSTAPKGPCPGLAGATCDDGNATDGDGCSSTCGFEPGFTCTAGQPTTCTDINECATAGTCGVNEFCRNSPGSYACSCRTGTLREGSVCVDHTQWPAWPIPDNPNELCTDGASVIACPAEGQPFHGQDGNRVTVAPSLTASVPSDIVTDNVTGLVWQRTVKGNGLNWDNAIAYCENLVQAGFDDWRMPSAVELFSVGNVNNNTAGLDIGYFTWDGNTSGRFWTTTLRAYDQTASFVWETGFTPRAKTFAYKVRCVRSATIPGPANDPANRYTCGGAACTATATDTIEDLRTGLTWERAAGQWTQNWGIQLDRCANLTLGGFDDWRAPSIKELFSTFDRVTGHIEFPFLRGNEAYISGTPRSTGFTNRIHIVSYWGEHGESSPTNGGRMRCVRGP